jgi:hypothetical protein
LDGLRRFVYEVFGAIIVTARGGAGNAVMQVLVEKLDPNALQCLADCGDLSQHVDAVRVVFDHAAEPTHLALDTTQPGEELLLVVGIPGEIFHTVTIPPGGILSLVALRDGR